ncbi:sulfite exporter TauE/SafE family protein [Halalkalibacterium ligniniphilum]|uniref:sulfite exporter TauE/SafE family protein n=1 Tax=Halalkalibacterium ligniniphilum TaxID=1134413 RepID=UPI00034AFF42|nr:sulfite exporter TauE/SafE family protein [Halalkalibacterium ligniniphilum]
MEWIMLVLIGIVAGTIGSLMGLGGGIIIVPALLLFSTMTNVFTEISPQVAVGTSLLIMIFTGLSSTLAYMKQKKIDYKSGFLFFIGSGPGALFGVWLNQGLDVDQFFIYFGLFVILTSFLLMIRHRLKPLPFKNKGFVRTYKNELGETVEYGFQPIVGILIAFVVGMTSGLFGIGGGSLMVPAMIVLFAFPPHVAVATSMFMILFSAILSSASHIALGNINYLYAAILIPGAWVGAQLGAAINARLKSDTLVFVFRLFLLFIGVRLIYQGWIG